MWFFNWFFFVWVYYLVLFSFCFIVWLSGMNFGWCMFVFVLVFLVFLFILKYSVLISYNVLMMLVFGFVGVGLYLVVSELSGKIVLLFIVGLVFGFFSYEMG